MSETVHDTPQVDSPSTTPAAPVGGGAVALLASGPSATPVHARVMALQRAAGNRAVSQPLARRPKPPQISELQSKGRKILDDLAAEEARDSPNEQRVAQLAKQMLEVHRQWSEGPGIDYAISDTTGDPLAGLYIPGLSYDTTLLSMKAAKYRPGAAPKPRPAAPSTPREPDPPSEYASMVPIPVDKLPGLATPELHVPTDPKGAKSAVAAAARGRFKRAFDFDIKKPLWLGELKKATITLDGTLDFKPDNSKGDLEINVGGLGSMASKIGEKGGMRGFGLEAGKKIENDAGMFAKAKGGLEVGQSQQDKGTNRTGFKAELSGAIEVGMGPMSGELKIVLGVDTSKDKDQWSLGTVKLSPVIMTTKVPMQIPLTNGATAQFTGKVYLTFEWAPDWPKIAAKMGLRAAPQATAAAAGGGGMTGGAAAIANGGWVAPAAGLAGIAITVWSFYEAAKDIAELKDLKPGADKAVADFIDGFMSAGGVGVGKGNTKSAMYGEGVLQGSAWVDSRVKQVKAYQGTAEWEVNMRIRVEEEYRRRGIRHTVTDKEIKDARMSEEDIRAAILAGFAANAERNRGKVYNAFNTAIRMQLVKAWHERNKGRMTTEKNEKYARAYAGLPPYGELSDKPDWTQLN